MNNNEQHDSSSPPTTTTNTSTTTTTSATIPISSKELQDIVDLFQNESALKFFETSNESKSARRSLNWVIYFIKRNELQKAREALIKIGEIISKINNELTTQISLEVSSPEENEDDYLNISLPSSFSSSSLLTINTNSIASLNLQVGKDIFHKVILFIEYLDKLMLKKSNQNRDLNNNMNGRSSSLSGSSSSLVDLQNSPSSSSLSSSSSSTNTNSNNNQQQSSTTTTINNTKPSNNIPNNDPNLKTTSKLQKFMSFIGIPKIPKPPLPTNITSSLSTAIHNIQTTINNLPSTITNINNNNDQTEIPNFSESYVKDQYILIELEDNNVNNNKNNVNNNTTNNKTTSTIGKKEENSPNTSSSSSSVSALQKRLERVMSSSSSIEDVTPSPTIKTNSSLSQQPQEEQPNNEELEIGIKKNNVIPPIKVLFIVEDENGKDLFLSSDFPNNLKEEHLAGIVNQFKLNLKKFRHSIKIIEILQNALDKLLPIKTQLNNYLELISTKEKNRKISFFLHILKSIFNIQMVNHYMSKKEEENNNSIELLESYSNFFDFDNFTYYILTLQIIAENFEHTTFCLSLLNDKIQNFSDSINSVNKFQVSKRELYKKVDELLLGHVRMRIIELTYCFGIDTFAIVTNDFDGDSLESLTLLLKCLNDWIQVKYKFGEFTESNNTPIYNYLHEWLKLLVRKIYITEREAICNNLKQSKYLKGFYFETSLIIHLSNFVVMESKRLNSRYGKIFDNHLNNYKFIDIIAVEFSKHLSVEVNAFCERISIYQKNCIETVKKNRFLKLYFNELPLGIFYKLCPLFLSKYKILQELSSFVKDFNMINAFYDIVSTCITIATPNRFSDFYKKIMTVDRLDKPIDKTVLYTFSCIDLANASLKPLQMIFQLDVTIRNNINNNKKVSFLTLYFEAIRPVIVEYLTFLSNRCRNELNAKTGNLHERIRKACIAFNNVNGLFIYAKDLLLQFNQVLTNYLLDEYERNNNNDNSLDDDDIDSLLNEKLIEVYDLPSVKLIMSEIQLITSDIALHFAEWIYAMNEVRYEAIFKERNNTSLFVFLSHLDRFFEFLSDNLYIELLYEVLKHLFVLYVQNLLRYKLLQNQQTPSSNSLLAPIAVFGVENKQQFDSSIRIPVKHTLDGLKDLFGACGEGIEQSFLELQSRELDVMLMIYSEDTDTLIKLYETLMDCDSDRHSNGVNQLMERFSSLLNINTGNVNYDENVDVNSVDNISTTSSTDSYFLQSLQYAIVNSSANEFLRPELILLLLSLRKKETKAIKFVKKQAKENKK
ncbi:hypothetical protein ABK040_010915 [Willaertia magna]